ncbi:MAG: hypothetical protein JW697_08865 [Kosmotogaceae bacterium]|nr:hypothetical protein [Kosmotogaceae bacterium]
MEKAIRKIEPLVSHSDICNELDPRWLSIKLIERDPEYRLDLKELQAA